KNMKKLIAWGRKVIHSFLASKCNVHAAGLTYFTLLAVVPVLCCILVVAKTCRVDEIARSQINRHIDATISNIVNSQDDALAKLTPCDEEARRKKKIAAEEFAMQARSVSNALFDRIEQFDVGTLGWIGFCALLWTVVSTLGSIETSFNSIFAVEKARPVWKRAYMYLFIMIVLPILVAVAMSMPILNVVKEVIMATIGATWLTKWVSDGLISLLDSWLFRNAFTLMTASIAFAFFLWVMPNCKVSRKCAFRGGLITAVTFGCWIKICAIAQVGIAKASALYGSFAFLPIILTWLYIGWQIILLGACMVKTFEDGEEAAS
ncbi:MAG: YihY/virulence factor BrkB family protein, partial [Kiritimatiellae bacterium]|nr:YihY/virulence factor BrkB family protein [Kiritimatiellia bacterium]